APAALTEASATAALAAQKINVLAISTAVPGLDGNPAAGSDYSAACGPPGGAPGQATRIAAATGGTFVSGLNPATIGQTTINLITAAVGAINNVRLVPAGAIADFVTSITPAGGYGPLPGDTGHTLAFDVTFGGTVPCKDAAQVFAGTLDVVADGAVVARKK